MAEPTPNIPTSSAVQLLPIYLENAETVRERLQRQVAPGWAVDEGVILDILLSICTSEFAKLWQELDTLFREMFPNFADGQFLDAHALSYGLTRGIGTYASGPVRFIGPEGTKIPAATVVGVPVTDPSQIPVLYETLNTGTVEIPAAGYIDLEAAAENVGANGNVGPGAVELLETNLLAEVSVTNSGPMTGGSDPQGDAELRVDVEAQERLPVGSGTVSDYVAWALSVAGVGGAAVTPLWDTSGATGEGSGVPNGTVAVSVLDPNNAPVDWTVVQLAQRTIDPSRALVALLEEGEPWVKLSGAETSTIGWSTTHKQVGETALKMTFGAADTAVAALTRAEDLSRFGPSDRLYVWIYASNWADVGTTSGLRFYTGASTYYLLPFSKQSAEGEVIPKSGSGWWLFEPEVGEAEVVGSEPVGWDAIVEVALVGVASDAIEMVWDYFSERSTSGAAGYGLAPIGAAVTVSTPVSIPVDVEAELTLASGYTLTGAEGTANVTELLRARLVAFLATVHAGETIYLNAIRDVIFRCPGVIDFTISEPSGNVALGVHKYAVLGNLELTAT